MAAAPPASPLRQLVRATMGATLPRRLFALSAPATSRCVMLTFDDGPHPQHTPALLDCLKARGVPATFFVLGREVERHPEIVRRMAAEGHDVGHHSYTHGEPAKTSSMALLEEVSRGARLLESILGRRPRLFRPPHGKLTLSKTLGLWAARQTVVLWNKDPKDFACGSAERLEAWFREHPLAGGDVVLLHDTNPYTVGAIDTIVERVTSAGLRFGTVSHGLGVAA
jgi:peptidoglycan/xylan/chitin deacetylase (PgdA/CDA1 family)